MRMLNPVHPGPFLRSEIIEAYNLSVTEAAKVLAVSRQSLSSLLNAKADLSGELALRFEKAFGVDRTPPTPTSCPSTTYARRRWVLYLVAILMGSLF